MQAVISARLIAIGVLGLFLTMPFGSVTQANALDTGTVEDAMGMDGITPPPDDLMAWLDLLMDPTGEPLVRLVVANVTASQTSSNGPACPPPDGVDGRVGEIWADVCAELEDLVDVDPDAIVDEICSVLDTDGNRDCVPGVDGCELFPDGQCPTPDELVNAVCNELDTDGNGDCQPDAGVDPGGIVDTVCQIMDTDGNGDCVPGVDGCELFPDGECPTPDDLINAVCDELDSDGNGDCRPDPCGNDGCIDLEEVVDFVCQNLDTDGNGNCVPEPNACELFPDGDCPTAEDVVNAVCDELDSDGNGDCKPEFNPCDLTEECPTPEEIVAAVCAQSDTDGDGDCLPSDDPCSYIPDGTLLVCGGPGLVEFLCENVDNQDRCQTREYVELVNSTDDRAGDSLAHFQENCMPYVSDPGDPFEQTGAFAQCTSETFESWMESICATQDGGACPLESELQFIWDTFDSSAGETWRDVGETIFHECNDSDVAGDADPSCDSSLVDGYAEFRAVMSSTTGSVGAGALPGSSAGTLRSEEGDGVWKLTLTPDQAPGEILESPPPGYDEFVGFSAEFFDAGEVAQDSGYNGAKVPGKINDPPEWVKNAQKVGACYRATIGYGGYLWAGAYAASGSGPIGWAAYGAGAAVGAGIVFAMCKDVPEMLADAGHWLGCLMYVAWWGDSKASAIDCQDYNFDNVPRTIPSAGGSRWRGHLLYVEDVIEITTSIDVYGRVAQEFAYENPNSTGWYEQQDAYNQSDASLHNAAWKAHNTFREVIGDAYGTVKVDVPLVATIMEETDVLLATLGTIPVGEEGDETEVFFDMLNERFVIGCNTVCADATVLAITSGGSGEFSPGEQKVEVIFNGDPGEAEVTVAGSLSLSGFTLSARTGGAAESPLDSLGESET